MIEYRNGDAPIEECKDYLVMAAIENELVEFEAYGQRCFLAYCDLWEDITELEQHRDRIDETAYLMCNGYVQVDANDNTKEGESWFGEEITFHGRRKKCFLVSYDDTENQQTLAGIDTSHCCDMNQSVEQRLGRCFDWCVKFAKMQKERRDG